MERLPVADVARRALAAALPEAAGRGPVGVAVAPGGVNLIGEHVDYNDGLVLPMAIDRHVAVAYRARDDGRLRAHAVGPGETLAWEPGGPPPAAGWFAYVAGAAWALRETGRDAPGADLAIAGDVPVASGLSSSAALTVAALRALAAAGGLAWDPLPMARLARRVEAERVGVNCGLMDPFAAACGRAGHALLLDCRDLTWEPVPLPPDFAVVVVDTAAPRALAGSAYNIRRAECEAALGRLRAAFPAARSLRDLSPAQAAGAREALRGEDDPREARWRRARHVTEEIARVGDFAACLRAGDLARAGALLDASHASLRDLYDVSCPELELAVGLARCHPACLGARLTGAGFGGCAVALVRAGEADAFAADVQARYRAASGRPGACFVARSAAGARLVSD